ncbi:MAG: transposase [Sphingobacteriaceae bacterium]|nr:MAG: transposase [Sphingobacteriaceae bacterium]
MSKEQVVREIHAYARKVFPRRKYTMFGIADTIQADLMEFQPFKRENRGLRYILIVIDVFSKMAFAEGIKDKTGVEVTKAMENIIRKIYQHNNRPIYNLQTDNGKEFFNSTMKRLLEKHNINHYASYSFLKSSIVERLIRTIKRKLYMRFSLQGTYKWVNILDEVIDKYNNTRFVFFFS